jgi:hypothetical protein
MSAICRIIAGVSGSPRSLPALRYGAALARGHGAVLIPLLTWAPPGGELADASCPCRYLRREWEGAARQRLDDAIHAAFGGMPDDVRTEMLVVRGEPVPPSALDLETGHGLQGWAFRHRGLTQRDLAALAGNSAGAR